MSLSTGDTNGFNGETEKESNMDTVAEVIVIVMTLGFAALTLGFAALLWVVVVGEFRDLMRK